jgi:hypothetical protein
MRKTIVILGLILLILPGLFLIAGGRGTQAPNDVSRSRFQFIIVLMFVPGIITTIVGLVLSPSEKKENDFRMKFWLPHDILSI